MRKYLFYHRVMKRIGFLSFGHWQPIAGLADADRRDALLQTIELAVAAEEIGIDGAFVRVHHFARQLALAVPAAGGDRRAHEPIEIGTAVIDMRYENPLYMAEDAAAADLIAGGRLQLGISRGSPEPALRRTGSIRLRAGARARPTPTWRAPTPSCSAPRSPAPASPHADPAHDRHRAACCRSSRTRPGLPERIWWGAGHARDRRAGRPSRA